MPAMSRFMAKNKAAVAESTNQVVSTANGKGGGGGDGQSGMFDDSGAMSDFDTSTAAGGGGYDNEFGDIDSLMDMSNFGVGGVGGNDDDIDGFYSTYNYDMDGIGGSVGGSGDYHQNLDDTIGAGHHDTNFNSSEDGLNIFDDPSSRSYPDEYQHYDDAQMNYGNRTDGRNDDEHHTRQGQSSIGMKNSNSSMMAHRPSEDSALTTSKTTPTDMSSGTTAAPKESRRPTTPRPGQTKIVPTGDENVPDITKDRMTMTKAAPATAVATRTGNSKIEAPMVVNPSSSFQRIVPGPMTVQQMSRVGIMAATKTNDDSTTKGVSFAAGTKTPKASECTAGSTGKNGAIMMHSFVTPSPYPHRRSGKMNRASSSTAADENNAFQTPTGRFNSPYLNDGGDDDQAHDSHILADLQGHCHTHDTDVNEGKESQQEQGREALDFEQIQEHLMDVLQQLNDIHEENVDQISHLEDVVEDAITKLLHQWNKCNEVHDEYDAMDAELDRIIDDHTGYRNNAAY